MQWRRKAWVHLLFILIAGQSLYVGSDEILRVGWGGTWEPFKMGTPDEPSGLDLEILEAMAAEAGFSLKHIPEAIPWTQLQSQLRRGLVDMVGSATLTEERAKYAYFIGPYRHEYVGLFVRKGESSKFPLKEVDGLMDMDFILGINSGFAYGKKLSAVFSRMGSRVVSEPYKVEGGIGYLNRRKLSAGRIDGFLAHPIDELLSLRGTAFADQIEMHPLPLINTGGIYVMLSKESCSQADADRLQHGLEKMKNNQVYARILAKYSARYNYSQW